MALSDTTLRNAKPRETQYKLHDDGGLFVIVRPSGGKLWRFKYRFAGKEQQLSAAAKHRPLNKRGPGNPPLEPDEELGSAFRLMATHLEQLDYYTVFDVLNSADFGTPQTRQRLLLLGSRDGEALKIPEPTHQKDGLNGLSPWRTFSQAISGLSNESAEFFKFGPTKERYLAQVPEGGNWRNLPEELKEEALGKAFSSWGGRSGFFRRLAWNKPSPTLTTTPDSKATSLCHPTELRPLSVQEYARVQEFPDDWIFEGSTRQKYEQIGNAVPLSLGTAAGLAIKAAMQTGETTLKKGKIECWNFDLLRKLTSRPKTILNPARMRTDKNNTSALQWYDGDSLKRRDALSFAPSELHEDFRKRLGFPEVSSSQCEEEEAHAPETFNESALAAQ